MKTQPNPNRSNWTCWFVFGENKKVFVMMRFLLKKPLKTKSNQMVYIPLKIHSSFVYFYYNYYGAYVFFI